MSNLLPLLAFQEVLDFFTSKTGIFAAIGAIIGFAAGCWGLWNNYTKARDARAEQEAKTKAAARGLALADVRMSGLSLSSNAYELYFMLTNTGSADLILRELQLHVIGRSAVDTVEPSLTLAPIEVHKHRVCFEPGTDVYDIRRRTFGPGHEPLAFAPAEATAFKVKLVSTEVKKYRFYIEARWYAAADPEMSDAVRSETLEAEFPERESAGPPRAGLTD